MTLDSRADELDRKLANNDIDSNIQALIKGARRQRRSIRLLAVSICIDIILTIGFMNLSLKTKEAAQLSQNNRNAIIQNCNTANDARKSQRTLWAYVISIPPQSPRTPEQEKRVVEFQDFVNKTFAQRDCQAEANSNIKP